jgi:hypothetical protein
LFAGLRTSITVTTARSAQDQSLRSNATRVANGYLEGLHALPYDDVVSESGLELTDPQGRTYTVDTTVTERDAVNFEAEGDQVKEVVTTVTWELRGGVRSATFNTVVAPEEVFLVEEGIMTVQLQPDPVYTKDTGHPTDAFGNPVDVLVLVTVNYNAPTVQIRWRDDDDFLKSETLTKDLAGSNEDTTVWRGKIPHTKLKRMLPEDAEFVEQTFTATGGAISTVHTLQIRRHIPDPPVIDPGSTPISPNPIVVDKKGQCKQPGHCVNIAPVTFTVTVTGLNEDPDVDADSVRVKFLLHDGNQQEEALARDPVNRSRWTRTIPAGTTKFLVGDHDFIFTTKRASDGATVERAVKHKVVAQ